MIKEQHTIDWSQMLNLIHLTGMEKSLKNQYQNATNISSRIQPPQPVLPEQTGMVSLDL